MYIYPFQRQTKIFYPIELTSAVIEDIDIGALWGGLCHIQIRAHQTDKNTTITPLNKVWYEAINCY